MELTTAQIAVLVGKSERTIQRWIANGTLQAERIGQSNRYMISEKDLQALTNDPHATELAELRALLADQEERIAALETLVTSLSERATETVAPATINRPARTAYAVSRVPQSQADTLPENWISVPNMAKAHGIHENTATGAAQSGRLSAIDGTWKLGRATVHRALDPAGQEQFVQLFRDNPNFHMCDDPSCACQTL